MIKIGIIGNGFVGRATKLLKCMSVNMIVYDVKHELCEPLETTLADIELCDLIFICLPTPLGHSGNFHTDLIENTINKISNPYKIIRSTVPIGFSQKYQCFFMPEFLTEANWKNDFINATHWIFGLLDNSRMGNNELNNEFKKRVTNLMCTSQLEESIKHSEIHWTTNSEAEFIKLAKNCFLATKVSIANELYDLVVKKISIMIILKIFYN
jgi:UDPglucose 6-dehydrogenase